MQSEFVTGKITIVCKTNVRKSLLRVSLEISGISFIGVKYHVCMKVNAIWDKIRGGVYASGLSPGRPKGR